MQIVLQVLRKSLHIIKNYTINSLTTTTNQILNSIQESPNASIKFSADNAYTMFYSKFRVNSTRIKTLMEQLEQRVESNNQPDYEQALADCHRCYIQQRKMFISSAVVSALTELVNKHQRDTCSLVKIYPFFSDFKQLVNIKLIVSRFVVVVRSWSTFARTKFNCTRIFSVKIAFSSSKYNLKYIRFFKKNII